MLGAPLPQPRPACPGFPVMPAPPPRQHQRASPCLVAGPTGRWRRRCQSQVLPGGRVHLQRQRARPDGVGGPRSVNA
eukprot:13748821-Alexandrium_andersonii.AAC.1